VTALWLYLVVLYPLVVFVQSDFWEDVTQSRARAVVFSVLFPVTLPLIAAVVSVALLIRVFKNAVGLLCRFIWRRFGPLSRLDSLAPEGWSVVGKLLVRDHDTIGPLIVKGPVPGRGVPGDWFVLRPWRAETWAWSTRCGRRSGWAPTLAEAVAAIDAANEEEASLWKVVQSNNEEILKNAKRSEP